MRFKPIIPCFFVICLLTSLMATAEDLKFNFEFESKSLSSALSDWSKKTNLDFISSSNLLKDKSAPAIHGELTAIEALDILLSNSDLIFSRQNDGSILIRAKPMIPEAAHSAILEEEIIVTGIRASLKKASDIKRDATGVVDAISSLDINKFPDTNLAEALQRITGVSIDRINNEGNKVTVRGLGPDFNLVTLNGRHMPVTAIPEISSLNSLAPATRSFEFINVSADGVSSVEVHKTAQADITTGGIGATIDIQTHRPLVDRNEVFSLGAKAVFDTSRSSPTPEISTLVNKTFSDDTIGVFFSSSFQERDSAIDESIINGWVGQSTAFSEWFSRNNYEVSNLIIDDQNQYADGQNWTPISQHFLTTEITRKRKNAQLTLQYSPKEHFITTIDLNYQGVNANPRTRQFGANFFGIPRDELFGQDLSSSIDRNGTTTKLTKNNAIFQYQQFDEDFINSTRSLGWNTGIQASPALKLSLDVHQAKAKSQRLIKQLQVLEIGADSIIFDGNHEVPTMQIKFANPFTPRNITTLTEPQPYTTFQQSMGNDIKQYQLKGVYENLEQGWLSHIIFGIDQLTATNTASVHEDVFISSWGRTFDFISENTNPDELFEREQVGSILNEFSGGTSGIEYIYTIDFDSDLVTTEKLTEGDNFQCYCTEPLAQHRVNETTDSFYIQSQFEGNFAHTPIIIQGGIRYESTNISVASLSSIAESIDWVEPEYTQIRYADERIFEKSKNSYSAVLPNLNARFEFLDNVLLRSSLSRSLSRSDLMQMRNQTTIVNTLSSELVATRGNSSLKPYTSNNFDLSLEWYYSEESYLSLGFFSKNIHNFISSESTLASINGLSDVYRGARAEAARQELRDEGIPATNKNTLDRIIANGGANSNLTEDGKAVVSNDNTDPLLSWNLRQPQNNKSAKISGWEFSFQHLFGDSGWGSIFNYTLVDSNVSYNVRAEGYQFAIPGVSDTLNLVGFYEKNKVKIRFAYNWRDQFLSSLSTFTGDHPQFTEAYEQWDFSASYDFSNQLSFVIEGINITAQNQRIFSRYQEQLISAKQFGSIYNIGITYKF